MSNILKRAWDVVESTAIRPITSKIEKEQEGRDIEDPNRIIRQGLLVVGIFFGSFFFWAFFGEIHGAVVAPGTIRIESQRKTVQHLEGGIVESILVKEGEEVKEGQTLIVLESVQIDASTEMIQKQLIAYTAAYERATVEKELKEDLVWSEELQKLADANKGADILKSEMVNFRARHDAIQGQISLLDNQRTQLEAQIRGYEDQLVAEDEIIRTLNEELNAKRQLQQNRFLDRAHILELERNLASHRGQRGRTKQAIAESKQRIVEIGLRIEDTRNRFVESASAETTRLNNEILQVKERIRPLDDAKKRLQIVAPVSGHVVDLKIHSKGGVVRPGEPLMDIVPADNPLIAEVQVPVHKVTEVYSGQEALVQMDAFDTRMVPHIPATVMQISADRLEERSMYGAMPYYLCYVSIDPEGLAKENVYLSPGMPVTVFITTKKRTVIYYMLEPLIKSWERALRD